MSCKCYHADRNFIGKIGVCWGTKECEPCSCNGDEAKCDFYDYVRNRARKEEYMNPYSYYDNEINYIVKQIKKIFNFRTVLVNFNLRDLYYAITFIDSPLLENKLGYLHRIKYISLEELRTKSYLTILKDLSNFLIEEMEL